MIAWPTRRQGQSRKHRPAIRVQGPGFVAWLVFDDRGHCIEAPPGLTASVGKMKTELLDYCARRGWKAEWVD